MGVNVAGYKIINVYKPPLSHFTPTVIPTFPNPSRYVGDFNCRHIKWGYNKTSPDDESMHTWATSNNLGVLHDPKETARFSSHRALVGTDSDRAASFLLSRLEQKKQERREEAVNSIGFSYSRCKPWRTIKKLTGLSGRSSRLCPASANAITSQLVKNSAYRTGDRESTRLVNKQLSDLWKIPTPEGRSHYL